MFRVCSAFRMYAVTKTSNRITCTVMENPNRPDYLKDNQESFPREAGPYPVISATVDGRYRCSRQHNRREGRRMNRRYRILVIDDDPGVIRFVRANLQVEGYEILMAMDGEEAIKAVEMEMPDLVILDIMVPKMDGFEICRQIREWSKVPIIMLSGRDGEEDKIECLNLGADDYITKPFGIGELLARVKAVLRRTTLLEEQSEPSFECGDLVIDFSRHQVFKKGKEINLTATEFKLISCLAHNADRVLTPNQILKMVWGEEYSGESHLVHVNIGRVRQKLEEDTRHPRYILNKPGIGYVIHGCKESREAVRIS
jgi:DNA-binding response OmpR family regulator